MGRHPELGGAEEFDPPNNPSAQALRRWGEPPVRLLFVRPCAAVWWVDAEGLQPLSFASGAQAEQQAHALARGFAAAGFDASIRVHDAAQALVGTVIYYARGEPSPPQGEQASASCTRTEASNAV